MSAVAHTETASAVDTDRRLKMQAFLAVAKTANAERREDETMANFRSYLDLCTDDELARMERIIAKVATSQETAR